MALRKASSYSKKYARPYTRKSSVKSQNFIKTVPQSKIAKFTMGDVTGYKAGKYKKIIKLASTDNIMIRDNSLEASRQFVHKILDSELTGSYYFEVKPVPHHILRENRVLTGAGADRMQTGMQQSFGSVIGKAAIVKKGQVIFYVAVANDKGRKLAVTSLTQIKSKIPGSSRLIFEDLK